MDPNLALDLALNLSPDLNLALNLSLDPKPSPGPKPGPEPGPTPEPGPKPGPKPGPELEPGPEPGPVGLLGGGWGCPARLCPAFYHSCPPPNRTVCQPFGTPDAPSVVTASHDLQTGSVGSLTTTSTPPPRKNHISLPPFHSYAVNPAHPGNSPTSFFNPPPHFYPSFFSRPLCNETPP